MLLAKFVRGPWDGEFLTLPTDDPWPRFIIPERRRIILVEYLYLLAGQENSIWFYLYEEDSLITT